jgi:5-methylcytosine-specific restriction endonuclease McrA
MNIEVLVLNHDYEPLNVCHMRRALALIYLGKADVLHTHGHPVAAASVVVDAPSVVRLRSQVRRPLPELRLSRRTVFARDGYVCQYCGHAAKDLTLDHVIPRRLGGGSEWDNLVTACRRCNARKSDKLLSQTNMQLMHLPRRPRYTPFISLPKYVAGRRNEAWRFYLPVFADVRE